MKLLFKPEFAAALRISVRQLERLVVAGTIPPADGYQKPGGSYWHSTPELKALVKEQRRPLRRR